MGSYNDKQPPVYIPPYDPPVGSRFALLNRHGRTVFRKQEDGSWEVVDFHELSEIT